VSQRESLLWEEMLEEFRALGGTADNVCLGQGRLGRGLFPRDPAKPVRVRISDNLLVDWKHVEFENDVFRISAAAQISAREKAFLENYYRDFSWGAGRQELTGLLQMMHDAPAELREVLRPFYAFRWLEHPTPKTVQARFLDSRVIGYKGGDVIMPIVELANHGHATQYQTADGVGLSGTFSGEILVQYQLCDPLQIFGKWGFASDSESFALSLPLKPGSLGIAIRRADVKLKSGTTPFLPKVTIAGVQMTLSYLMRNLESREPATLEICALLTKPDRREIEVPVRYVGFEIPNRFVIGYGLDFGERYRNLPYVAVLSDDALPEGF